VAARGAAQRCRLDLLYGQIRQHSTYTYAESTARPPTPPVLPDLGRRHMCAGTCGKCMAHRALLPGCQCRRPGLRRAAGLETSAAGRADRGLCPGCRSGRAWSGTQWIDGAKVGRRLQDPAARARIADEAADMLMHLVQFADVCGIDLLAEAYAKIEPNESRFRLIPKLTAARTATCPMTGPSRSARSMLLPLTLQPFVSELALCASRPLRGKLGY